MTLVSSYVDNSMSFALIAATETLTTGLIYKFKFRATNSYGYSQDSDVVAFALVDVPAAPASPQIIYSSTSET